MHEKLSRHRVFSFYGISATADGEKMDDKNPLKPLRNCLSSRTRQEKNGALKRM